MLKKILTEKQELLINQLPEEIQANFYPTGGTALSAFYLGHRLTGKLFAMADRFDPKDFVDLYFVY